MCLVPDYCVYVKPFTRVPFRPAGGLVTVTLTCLGQGPIFNKEHDGIVNVICVELSTVADTVTP